MRVYGRTVRSFRNRLLPTALLVLLASLLGGTSALATNGPYPGGPMATNLGGADTAGGIWLKDYFDFRLEGDNSAAGSIDNPFSSVDNAGDWNNDGIDDYVVGQWDEGSGGQACIVFGKRSYQPQESTRLANANRICVHGPQNGDDLGSSVAGGIDVGGPRSESGAPIPDVVVGGIDLGAGSPGGAYVIFGQDCQNRCERPVLAQRNGSVDDGWVRYYGDDALGGDAGASVALTNDMNGDGLGEIVIGDPDYDNNDASANCDSADKYSCGAVWVVFGGQGGNPHLNNVAGGFRIDGRSKDHYGNDCNAPAIFCYYGHAGQSVAGGGDINGDGRGDIVIGAPNDNADDEGAAFVVFGKAVTANLNLDDTDGRGDGRSFRINPAGSDDDLDFGYTVSIAPDMNRDGRDEVLIGDPHYQGERGAAYVIFGKTSSDPVTAETEANSGRGFMIVGAQDDIDGDVDGDLLAAGGLAGVKDINGDLRGDIIVGAPSSDATSPNDVADRSLFGDEDFGAVYIVHGQAQGGQIRLGSWNDKSKFLRIEGETGATWAGASAGDELGGNADDYGDYYTHMVAGGDFNDDGVPDVIASAPWWDGDNNNDSAVYAILGSSIEYGSLDANGGASTRSFDIRCGERVSINPTRLIGYAGQNNSRTISIVGDELLPEGLSLDQQTGRISGTVSCDVADNYKVYERYGFRMVNDYTGATRLSQGGISIRVTRPQVINIPPPNLDGRVQFPDHLIDGGEPQPEPEPEPQPEPEPAPVEDEAGGDQGTVIPAAPAVSQSPGTVAAPTPPVCTSKLKLISSRTVTLKRKPRKLRIRLRGPAQLRAGSGASKAVYRLGATDRRGERKLSKLIKQVKFTVGSQRLPSDRSRPFTVVVDNELAPGSYTLKATVFEKRKSGQRHTKKRILRLRIRVVGGCK